VSAKELIIQEGTYYSQADEKAFFDRLSELRCVKSIRGGSDGLHIALSRPPTEMQLREIIALLYRYSLDMTPLAALRTERNAAWFAKDRKMFWHARVFGKSRPQFQTVPLPDAPRRRT
jgi:hypothetical protein